MLRKAVSTGLPNYPVFQHDPHLAGVQAHPQFQKLMTALKRDWDRYHREFAAPL